MTSQYGDLRRHLYNDEGKLRSFVNIYLGDEDIRFLQREQTPLESKRRAQHRSFHCRGRSCICS